MINFWLIVIYLWHDKINFMCILARSLSDFILYDTCMYATCGMPGFLSFKVPIHLESPTFSNVNVLVSALSDLT